MSERPTFAVVFQTPESDGPIARRLPFVWHCVECFGITDGRLWRGYCSSEKSAREGAAAHDREWHGGKESVFVPPPPSHPATVEAENWRPEEGRSYLVLSTGDTATIEHWSYNGTGGFWACRVRGEQTFIQADDLDEMGVRI